MSRTLPDSDLKSNEICSAVDNWDGVHIAEMYNPIADTRQNGYRASVAALKSTPLCGECFLFIGKNKFRT